jgi:hypothetical protein
MGFARRMVRKSVRKATPRAVRQVMHPVRSAKNAVTPRGVKQLSRAVYTITNPLGAAENALIGSVLHPGRGRTSKSRTTSTYSYVEPVGGTGVRATEAVESYEMLEWLMEIQHERFKPVEKPIEPTPARPALAPYVSAEWATRKKAVRLWQRKLRTEIKSLAIAAAESQVAAVYAAKLAKAEEKQKRLDAWWLALNRGDASVTTAALVAAFRDNPAPVVVLSALETNADLVLLLPREDVLPIKKAHVTPTGRLSSKAWTKSEFADLYAELIGAHLLATIRETWAAAPSVSNLRVLGARVADAGTLYGNRPIDVLFNISTNRDSHDWTDDGAGEVVLLASPMGLSRVGRTYAVTAWPTNELGPEVVQRIDQLKAKEPIA